MEKQRKGKSILMKLIADSCEENSPREISFQTSINRFSKVEHKFNLEMLIGNKNSQLRLRAIFI